MAARLGNHSEVLLIGRESHAFSPQNGALCSKRIIAEWDFVAKRDGKRLIVEKTPKHVQSVRTIRRILPNAKIITTVRNPLDNVASLYKRFGNLKACVGRWIVDNAEVKRISREPYVTMVKYEDVTRRPKDKFQEVARFLDLQWEDQILDNRESMYSQVIYHDNMRIRAEQVSRPIEPRTGSWQEVFNSEQITWILKKTNSLANALGYTAEEEANTCR